MNTMTSSEDIKEIYEDMSELINNLNDDLELDLVNGEDGYINHKESYLAIKKYTLETLKEKFKKWEKRFNEALKEEQNV